MECWKGGGGDEEPGDPEKFKVLAIIKENDEYGSVRGDGEYAAGEVVQLTAIAKSGYRFVKWNIPNNITLINETNT